MLRLIAMLIVVAALIVAPAVKAETVTCTTSQYGGATCGVSTSTETVVEHKVVETGVSDQLYLIIASMGATALVASVLYKLTYRSYILG